MTNKLNSLYNSSSRIHLFSCELTKFVGKNESILLNQINYWLSKSGREIRGLNGKWIYNSLNEWHKQFNYWSLSTLRRTIKSLEKSGILISKKINAKKWNHTKWYSIEYNKLNQLIKHATVRKEEFANLPRTNYLNKSYDHPNNKRTYRCVQNEQIIITKNNYTNKSSYKKCENILNKNLKEEDKLNVSEKETVKQMIELWNKVFEHSIKPIKAYSNKKSEQTLLRLYKTIFNSDLDNWREYACKVNSSQFLMGEKKTKTNFKAIFSWLIKLETIEKILNGEYGVGDRELDMNNISKNEEIKKEDTVNQIDNKVSERIRLNINESKEKEEFENYVRESGYEEDGDIYKISKIFKQIPKYSFFNLTEYKEMRKTLFDSYVVKKYMGMDRIEMRDLIRNKIGEENQSNSMKYLK